MFSLFAFLCSSGRTHLKTSTKRTEAQQRGALHAHILVWFRKREAAPNWQALPANPRTVKGHGPKQQKTCSAPTTGVSTQCSEVQHDSCYQLAEMGRVSAELPRPIVTPVDHFGGYDIEMLRVGALARTMLIRLKYLHICSPVYCLKEPPARLIFPRHVGVHCTCSCRCHVYGRRVEVLASWVLSYAPSGGARRTARPAVSSSLGRSKSTSVALSWASARVFTEATGEYLIAIRRSDVWFGGVLRCYCLNTERVALRRRLPEDDQWVVPHNLYLAMSSPSSVNVPSNRN